MKGYKVIRKDMTQNGFTYQRGLNTCDTSPGKSSYSGVGGILFFKDLKNLSENVLFGDDLWRVEVPQDAQVIQYDETRYFADKLILTDCEPLSSLDLWKNNLESLEPGIMWWAAYKGYEEIVDLILSEGNTEVSLEALEALVIAQHKRHESIAHKLWGHVFPGQEIKALDIPEADVEFFKIFEEVVGVL